jgi:hypothetical protein
MEIIERNGNEGQHSSGPGPDDSPGEHSDLRSLLASIQRSNRQRQLLAVMIALAALAMLAAVILIYTWRTKTTSEISSEIVRSPTVLAELSDSVSKTIRAELPNSSEFVAKLSRAAGQSNRQQIDVLQESQQRQTEEIRTLDLQVSTIKTSQAAELAEMMSAVREDVRRDSDRRHSAMEGALSDTVRRSARDQVELLRSDLVHSQAENNRMLQERLDRLESAVQQLESRIVAVRDLTVLAVASRGKHRLPLCGVDVDLRGWHQGALRIEVNDLGGGATRETILLRKGEPTMLGNCSALLLERWFRLVGPDVVAVRIHPVEK